MNDTIGTITLPLLKHCEKNCILALVMLYETRNKNTTKVFIFLSCVIYTIIDNYLCIDYLAWQIKATK